jgi:multidrug resistance efflux pump
MSGPEAKSEHIWRAEDAKRSQEADGVKGAIPADPLRGGVGGKEGGRGLPLDRTVTAPSASRSQVAPRESKARLRILPFLLTLVASGFAAAMGWAAWRTYMATPWTRDGTVRTYVIAKAPEVAGRIVEIHAANNQFVHKDDLLLAIDPTNYQIALKLAEAAVTQTGALAENAEREAVRRAKLNNLAVTEEEQQTYASNAAAAQAQYQQAVANRDQAKVNLERTQIHSPVNGWVTNLLVQPGDYASVGRNVISVVDADSFWVDGYFEETRIGSIREGDPAKIKLLGYSQIVRGEVSGVARGITVANAVPDLQGLASVNPIFTWVRLAQRVPVSVRITEVPDGVRLVAGMTATVEIESRR